MRRVVAVVGLVVALWLCGAAQVRCLKLKGWSFGGKTKKTKNPLSGVLKFLKNKSKKNKINSKNYEMVLQQIMDDNDYSSVPVVFRSNGKCFLNIDQAKCINSSEGVCLRLDGKTECNANANDGGAITAPEGSIVLPIGTLKGNINPNANYAIVALKDEELSSEPKKHRLYAVHPPNKCIIVLYYSEDKITDELIEYIRQLADNNVGVFLMWKKFGKIDGYFTYTNPFDCHIRIKEGQNLITCGVKELEGTDEALKVLNELTEVQRMQVAFLPLVDDGKTKRISLLLQQASNRLTLGTGVELIGPQLFTANDKDRETKCYSFIDPVMVARGNLNEEYKKMLFPVPRPNFDSLLSHVKEKPELLKLLEPQRQPKTSKP